MCGCDKLSLVADPLDLDGRRRAHCGRGASLSRRRLEDTRVAISCGVLEVGSRPRRGDGARAEQRAARSRTEEDGEASEPLGTGNEPRARGALQGAVRLVVIGAVLSVVCGRVVRRAAGRGLEIDSLQLRRGLRGRDARQRLGVARHTDSFGRELRRLWQLERQRCRWQRRWRRCWWRRWRCRRRGRQCWRWRRWLHR